MKIGFGLCEIMQNVPLKLARAQSEKSSPDSGGPIYRGTHNLDYIFGIEHVSNLQEHCFKNHNGQMRFLLVLFVLGPRN